MPEHDSRGLKGQSHEMPEHDSRDLKGQSHEMPEHGSRGLIRKLDRDKTVKSIFWFLPNSFSKVNAFYRTRIL